MVSTDEANGVRCMLMRGGTSKGAYFLAQDLPTSSMDRNDLLLRLLGSPDARQIDGIGGAHPLTSKVAIVSPSDEEGVDVDYLFLQVGVDEAIVSTGQTCGNILAGVAPFAIERNLVDATPDHTTVRVRLVNTGDLATATVHTPGGVVDYDGDLAISGVPGTGGRIEIVVDGAKRVLPTNNVIDLVDQQEATLIDAGMPVVLLASAHLGIAGDEAPTDLENNKDLTERVERVRCAAGPLMGLGDVTNQTVPKVILLAPPLQGGDLTTRAFIPARVHTSLGVLMGASIAAASHIPGTIAASIAPSDRDTLLLEHPSGTLAINVTVQAKADGWYAKSFSERTARKLFDGLVFARPRP